MSCAESLKPRLAASEDGDGRAGPGHSRIALTLATGNKARIGPLRLRVTQDGTKILGMRVVVQGVALEKEGTWTFAISGPNETLRLETGPNVTLLPGRAYRMSGKIVEDDDGELMLRAESADPIPQP